MTLYEDLQYRGLIKDITSPDLIDKLNKGGLKFYVGSDPTADSLHIGHYLTVVATSKRLKDAGHTPILLVGGGTGLIGDPKPNTERPMISKEAVEKNIAGLTKQLNSYFDVEVVNNADWLLGMDAIDYLRDYGKYFNINYMINKDTVKRRLETGISYTEFSYMILQSIDFLKLYENHGVTMQIGGQDQWGNITSGLELIRKVHGIDTECYGFTVPLMLKADGTKFGKSESGECFWLDINKTSAYKMYQFLYNTDDASVINFLKKLTFLTKEEIDNLEEETKNNPHLRLAQKALAKEVVTFLHGEEECQKALDLTEILFKEEFDKLKKEDVKDIFDNSQMLKLMDNVNIIDLLVESKITSSKREARELVTNNAISINGNKINDINLVINENNLIDNTYLIVKKGKKNYFVFEK